MIAPLVCCCKKEKREFYLSVFQLIIELHASSTYYDGDLANLFGIHVFPIFPLEFQINHNLPNFFFRKDISFPENHLPGYDYEAPLFLTGFFKNAPETFFYADDYSEKPIRIPDPNLSVSSINEIYLAILNYYDKKSFDINNYTPDEFSFIFTKKHSFNGFDLFGGDTVKTKHYNYNSFSSCFNNLKSLYADFISSLDFAKKSNNFYEDFTGIHIGKEFTEISPYSFSHISSIELSIALPIIK
ncbi:hypothetical protein CPIN18021_0312 [Campylobacter pinnipediorum subsp. caledonicus]|uniref:Uncharacterized protein n=1 Tax=Campylobacter pinnipediorum subsp. caledonicus TaxID=1874362 RepID=A0A1S6U648_9BACT|nr:hypothetical protein [Campylobacter pinnipediorum]AQW85526.1 hypothetical protein CPIN18020_0282 [Campylobacter pinnipediorum subsp. caledonicus]AQW87159.1 hypothetical protein CPIN18021_0312 [Campylobacter pinnipediorum subsp. caledonicus]OPA72032.1 hypothetical protein BB381_00320 [Campylobacter pinnipediorum subsp. caledonicus]